MLLLVRNLKLFKVLLFNSTTWLWLDFSHYSTQMLITAFQGTQDMCHYYITSVS